MAGLAGDAAEWVDEARETEEGRKGLATGLLEPVLTIAHYALALLAEACAEEDEEEGLVGWTYGQDTFPTPTGSTSPTPADSPSGR